MFDKSGLLYALLRSLGKKASFFCSFPFRGLLYMIDII
jgi:hypothetical protein